MGKWQAQTESLMLLQRWDPQIHSCRECITIASNTCLCCSQGWLSYFFSQISHVSSSAPHWARIPLCWWQTECWMELPVGLMRQTSVYMASARWSNFLLFYFWCQVQSGAAPWGWLGGCPWGEGTTLFYRGLYKCSMACVLVWESQCPRQDIIPEQLGMLKNHICLCAWLGWEVVAYNHCNDYFSLTKLHTDPKWGVGDLCNKTSWFAGRVCKALNGKESSS